ncbi:MAG: hypothetical protein WBQ75_00295 [Acetobacteraceae bacterium]
MTKFRTAALGAVASLALIGGAGVAGAQTRTTPRARMIEVPPGAVVIVLPAGAMPAVPLPMEFPAMPDPGSLMRQVNAMFADMQHMFASPMWSAPERTIEAAMRRMPSVAGPVSGILVTSITNANGTCTRRVIYSGNGAPPEVKVNSTGSACAAMGTPTAVPAAHSPRRMAPHTILVDNRAPAEPIQVAQLGD